ncbi:uncharacterized protein MELLADRAFT_95975 [Melampsora larici-populina 98AG31]|uniref:Vesicle tethering protein Uso1/P115-like head domain-containing protein n=1 Tax=Melampsora larici-populina (strain 98AG31 / pathotype 3-4-7) TaxID=747676 RepID=F4RDY5_MELLP|nr:uncharacterized protein MELLADRAFT_95975 [Melampsora larici-populina 98AG31]EGG09486.1 hypothetical protein MELLADRAFT_95975 [Melampsora larici-populina 98AG31]
MSSEETNQKESSDEEFKVSIQIQKDVDEFLETNFNSSHSIETKEIINLTQITQTLANHLRDLRLRDSIGQSLVIPHTLKLLRRLITESNLKPNDQIIEAIEQLMRVIGNLVHTHDINRSKSLSFDASKIFYDLINLDYFKNLSNLVNLIQPHTHCLQIIITVLFNLCFEYVPAHIAYIEVGLIKPLSYLVELIGEIHFEIPLLSIRLLDELSSTDDAKQMMPNDILQGLLSPTFFIQSNDLNSLKIDPTDISSLIECLSISTTILESLTETSQPIQKALKTLSISTRNPINPSNKLINPPSELLNTVVGRLLYFVRYNELPIHWLDQIIKEEEEESLMNVMNKSKANLSKTLINVNGIDQEEEEEWLIRLLVGWVSEVEVIENRPDLMTTIGILLGNFSCSDFKSIKLIQHYGILDPLVNAFQIWSNDDEILGNSRPGEQVQVLHSLIGLARNLSVADENKEGLGNSGLIELALKCLGDKYDVVQPLIGLTLGFLRHVCKRNLPNVLRFISEPNLGLEKVIKVKKRIEQRFIKLEVMRLIASSITLINSNPSNQNQIEAESLNQIESFSSNEVIECLIDLLKIGVQNDLLLVNEALVSLTILACKYQSGFGFAVWIGYRLVGLLLKDEQPIKEEEEEEDKEEEGKRGIDLVLKCYLGLKKTKNEDRVNETQDQEDLKIKDLKMKNEMKFHEIIKKNSMILMESLMKTLRNGPTRITNRIEKDDEDEDQKVKHNEGLELLDLIKDVLKGLNSDELSDEERKDLNELLMI